jgi:acetyl-CoA acetyltransferase
MSERELLICAPVRTAIPYNGTLKDTPAVELGATVIKACLERAGPLGPVRRHRRHGQCHSSRQ